MMRMKKLISLILTLVMMLSLLPMAALAEAGAISAVNDEELSIPDLEVRDFDPEDYADGDEFPVPDMEERDFEPTLTEAEGEDESLFLFAEPDEETFVSVEAPYGAQPASSARSMTTGLSAMNSACAGSRRQMSWFSVSLA